MQAAFLFPNGRIRLGAVTLNAGEGPSGHQPMIFLGDEPLNFYSGGMVPTPKETRQFLRELKKVSSVPLPIRYLSAIHSNDGAPLAVGRLDGLYWMSDWRTGKIDVV